MHRFHQPFLYEATDEIIAFKNCEQGSLIQTKNTIFYPGGGGQPCDVGVITHNNVDYKVIEVLKNEEGIWHRIQQSKLQVDDKVILKVNQKRRNALVAMHTGEHILFQSLQQSVNEISMIKIDLGVEQSSLFVHAPTLDWDMIGKAEQLCNNIIHENRPIFETEMEYEIAKQLPHIRMNESRINEKTVRVVEVQNFDWSACFGIHAPHTGYVQNLLITNFVQHKGGWHITFTTRNMKQLLSLALTARKIAVDLESDYQSLYQVFSTVQKNEKQYKTKARTLEKKMLQHPHIISTGSLKIAISEGDNIEKKNMVDAAVQYTEKYDLGIVISHQQENNLIAIASLKLNANELLHYITSQLGGKGGGKPNFAMGSIPHTLKITELIANYINEHISS